MILVTGATGLSGSLVVQELARRNVPARLLVRNEAKAAPLKNLPGMELVKADMGRPETLAAALAGVDRALMISTANRDMLETQCRFIDACRDAGVRHIIKFSGAEPGFDPRKFLFTRMHEEIEDHLENSGLAWTHLRPSQFMQVYLREMPTIIADDAFYLPFADIELAPIDQADIAKIAVALLRDGGHEGKSYDMTGPEALTMHDIAERLSAAAGRTIRYVPVTPEERNQAMRARGIPAYFVDALDDQTRERLRHKKAKIRLGAHETFGVVPTTFAQFACRHAAMLRSHAVAQSG
jgi:uncharacterized protein YbjT (DUF2867 family)